MRVHSKSLQDGARASALWGTGKRGSDNRSRNRWSNGSGGALAALVAVLALAVPLAASAGDGQSGSHAGGAVVSPELLDAARTNGNETFRVIVQGVSGVTSSQVAADVRNATHNNHVSVSGVEKEFASLDGVAGEVTGEDILQLAQDPSVLAITPDAPMVGAAYSDASMWPTTTGADKLWGLVGSGTLQAQGRKPAIAIVDSGVDASKAADFGDRVVASVNLSSTSPGTADLQGHGTMVAGIAAGAFRDHPGAANEAPIVSLRTADADGRSLTSDLIAACDWILANGKRYNVRVANFSLIGTVETSFRFDPLDKAVEKLWLNGVTVVTAAGNHGTASAPAKMGYAPANDPFVITVGATDQNQTSNPLDDTMPDWSAFGYTADGFSKPEIAAPGRYLVMPVPAGSTIASQLPDRVREPGYMWMSGTSFSSGLVSGVAAQLLALHPNWGPDDVKGALMLTARSLPLVTTRAAGVGEIDGNAASAVAVPPNPNENLYAFVKVDPVTGLKIFDADAWTSYASTHPTWSPANWSSVSWSSVSWSSVSWSSVSWSSVSWSSVSWSSVSWSSVSWSSVSWSSVSWSSATAVS